MLLRLFEISRRFNMQIQPQLMLLQKTLLNVEGLGRELYPELDIWNTASPILRDWMRERTSVAGLLRALRTQCPELIDGGALRCPSCCKRLLRERPDAAARPSRPRSSRQLRQELERMQGAAAMRCCVAVLLLIGGGTWLALARGHAWLGWTLLAAGSAQLALRTAQAKCNAPSPKARSAGRALQVRAADPVRQHTAVAQRLGEFDLGGRLPRRGGAHRDLQRQHGACSS